ncbi:arginyltransferase [Vreelandella populi]|uniref:Aspartate/glutamate leucyltransferase n=1 Tax=Vreelandella populi TaxID=2498858 RepID=A0A3S0YLL1_9GAMM|nr:arginyltransferase [Halomonas populi]RUR38008.1 arginyltransferase [Halomonas populi]RUR48986.1 arginyltransferase [Halomonas populi]RUR55329.1 arginyltransferase [Halomonas populi]
MSSNAPRGPVRDLRFFLTVPHICSYLPHKEATTLFLDPQESPGRGVYDSLSLLGFRRSGRHLYRPHCENCNACRSVRIPVEQFTANRSQRKVWRRNADITTRIVPARYEARHYALYAEYIRQRHADGDMYPPSREQYQTFLTLSEPYAYLLEMYLGEELVAVSAFDQLEHGLSAIYTFFGVGDTLDRRSLGTLAVLKLIELCVEKSLPHLYLGYWIEECRKMRYKQDFSPTELLDGGHWRPLIR